MYEVIDAEYCGIVHATENTCTCKFATSHCCHVSSRCHIVLILKAQNKENEINQSNMFRFNYRVSNESHIMAGGRVPLECTIHYSQYEVYLNGRIACMKDINSLEELVPMLNLSNAQEFAIKICELREMKKCVYNMLKTYTYSAIMLVVKEREEAAGRDPYDIFIGPDDDEYIQVAEELNLPTYEWVMNEEYTAEQLLITHPFFGNVSEMVVMRMTAVNELYTQVNDFINPPVIPLLK